jgi:hypothetical protein
MIVVGLQVAQRGLIDHRRQCLFIGVKRSRGPTLSEGRV